MATAIKHNPKFNWEEHDISKLRREYYELGLGGFMEKYKTGKGKVYLRLGRIPDHLRKKGGNTMSKKKLEVYENTTKVARMYEKKMKEHESPKYTGPWAQFMKPKH